MTIGSAASRAGTLPQAPLSLFPMARRDKGVAILPYGRGDAAPPRFVPLQKAAGEPPRGHVLVAAADAGTALAAQRLLADSGYRVVGPAPSTEEINRLIGRAHQPPSCGVVHLDLPDAAAIADRLVARDIPVVWLASAANPVLPIAHAAAPVVHEPLSRTDLLEAVEASIRHRATRGLYVTPPPRAAWPRVFPQL